MKKKKRERGYILGKKKTINLANLCFRKKIIRLINPNKNNLNEYCNPLIFRFFLLYNFSKKLKAKHLIV